MLSCERWSARRCSAGCSDSIPHLDHYLSCGGAWKANAITKQSGAARGYARKNDEIPRVQGRFCRNSARRGADSGHILPADFENGPFGGTSGGAGIVGCTTSASLTARDRCVYPDCMATHLDASTGAQLITAQHYEITEHHFYSRLARRVRDAHNSEILAKMGNDEKEHYDVWKGYTGVGDRGGPSRARTARHPQGGVARVRGVDCPGAQRCATPGVDAGPRESASSS